MNAPGRDQRAHQLSEFRRMGATLPGANVPWLQVARGRALERFAQSGLPTTRDEEWKYTSVAAIEKHTFETWPGAGASQSDAAALVREASLAREPGGAAALLLVFHNGRHVPALSASGAPGTLPPGVTLDSLAAVLEATPQALEPYLADVDDQTETVFGTLNMAFMADGAYLHLARGCVLEQPVHLLFVATHADGASPWAVHPRNLIVAEEGAQATVIEHYVGGDGTVYWTNVVTRIFAAAGARIEHCVLQQEAAQALHVAGIHVRQQGGSVLTSHSIALGAALTRNDLTTVFAAPGCEATLNGLYLPGGRQHVDNHTRIDHLAANGSSREYYRGVLDGRAHAVFNGKVVVHPAAQKSDAYQANHNLLLSRDAEVDTKPQLEIFADDVKCTHGATVGQLDEEQVFYLRSRGVEEAMARSLLVHAFAHDVIERFRVRALRSRLDAILLARLPQGARIKELT